MTNNPLLPEHFERYDNAPDDEFYSQPRLVTHIDDHAIAAATRFYRETLPPEGDILDLCSSWVSHLPADVKYRSVTGLGMNQVELDTNPVLTRRTVHDLNLDPVLPYGDAEFDAAIMTVSIQYMVHPIDVFRDLARTLRFGAPVIITYSNRCFPTKAVAVWRGLGDREHADLIGLYFRLAEKYDPPNAYDLSPDPHGASDPLYAVVAKRHAADW